MDRKDFEEANVWLAYATNDFEVVELLAQQAKPKYEIICYHSQQCIEKILKGFIALNGGKLQKTHDLVLLCNLCIAYDVSFSEILNNCSDLTIYAAEVRYPNNLQIDEYHMLQAIEDMRVVRDFVLGRIHPSF